MKYIKNEKGKPNIKAKLETYYEPHLKKGFLVHDQKMVY